MDTFTLRFHKDTTPEQHESTVRAVSYLRNGALKRLRQYEGKHRDYARLSIDAKTKKVEEQLWEFKELLERHAYRENEDGGVQYVYLTLAYPDYLDILENASTLPTYLQNQGGYVSDRIFTSVTEGRFTSFLEPISTDARILGAVDIVFDSTHAEAIKSMCFWVSPMQESDPDFARVARDAPDAQDLLDDPMMRRFLKDPHSNPEALAYMMDALQVADPLAADVLKKTLRRCHVCHAHDVKVFQCSRCKAVYYCSKECQQKDWTDGEHRKQCTAN